jgi:hypothetical protein
MQHKHAILSTSNNSQTHMKASSYRYPLLEDSLVRSTTGSLIPGTLNNGKLFQMATALDKLTP